MGKKGVLGLVFSVIVGFLTFFTYLHIGELQNKSIIEPVNSAMTVGEMRLTPHGDPDGNGGNTPHGDKGIRARDLMAEVNNDIKRGIETSVLYLVDWKFVDKDGNDIQLSNSVVDGSGKFSTQEINKSFDEDSIVHEAEYTIHRYNDSQALKDEGGKVIGVKDKSKPVSSTKFRWSLYADEDVQSDAPTGLTGGEDTNTNYYTNIN